MRHFNNSPFPLAIWMLFCGTIALAYLTDTKIYSPPDYNTFLPPPAGGSYVDPVIGTTITRLTDAIHTPSALGGNLTMITAEYSTASPFNVDNSRILLQEDTYFGLYDGSGKRIKPLLFVTGESEPRWSRKDPNIFYFHKGNQLLRYSVKPEAQTVIHTFKQYKSVNFGKGESELSYDGDHLVVAGDARYIFVYTISTNTEGRAFDSGGRNPEGWDCASITPDNNVAIEWKSAGTGRYQGTELYDINMKFLRQVFHSTEHRNFTRDADGSEVMITANAGDPFPPSDCADNDIVKVDLASGKQTCLLHMGLNENYPHIATPEQNGWAYVSIYDSEDPAPETPAWALYTQEIFALRLDGSEVRRLLHHRSRPLTSYWWQPRVTVSRDGTRLLYTSNYGLQKALGYPASYADVYMVRIPWGRESGASSSTNSATPRAPERGKPGGTQP